MSGVETIRLHRANAWQEDKNKPENNVYVNGNRIEIWSGKQYQNSKGYGTEIVDLREDAFALMNQIAGTTKEKGETQATLTERDFAEFRKKYENDKNFRAQINRKYNVNNIKFEKDGLTKIDFKDASGSSDFKIDFQTNEEKAKIEADKKAAEDEAATARKAVAAKEKEEQDAWIKENTTGWKGALNGIKAFLYDRWLRH